jgi:hypothetical protein
MKHSAISFILLMVLLLSACAEPGPTPLAPPEVTPTTPLADPIRTTQSDPLQALAQFQALAGLPNATLEFVELTIMINSPDGRLSVALYQDSQGRKFSLDSTINQVIEMDARALLPSLSPETNPLTLNELRSKAENLVAATTPDFAQRQEKLTYNENAKGLYFFEWREKGNSTWFNPPFAQVGLLASGELMAYINTLVY